MQPARQMSCLQVAACFVRTHAAVSLVSQRLTCVIRCRCMRLHVQCHLVCAMPCSALPASRHDDWPPYLAHSERTSRRQVTEAQHCMPQVPCRAAYHCGASGKGKGKAGWKAGKTGSGSWHGQGGGWVGAHGNRGMLGRQVKAAEQEQRYIQQLIQGGHEGGRG